MKNSDKKSLGLALSLFFLLTTTVQYLLQINHVSFFVIKNYLLQITILILIQIIVFLLKEKLPEHSSTISRINIFILVNLTIVFVSIYSLDFPIKEVFSLINGVVLLIFCVSQADVLAKSFQSKPAKGITILIIGGLILLGVWVRIFHLEDLPIMVDELIHLNQAKDIMSGQPITYTRSLLPITIPVTLFVKYSANPIYWARVYCIVLNVSAIIPLYFLVKQVNPLAGFVSVFLFVSSPWMIFRSQMIREYAYLPLVIYSLLLVFMKVFILIEKISDKTEKNINLLLGNKQLILGFILFTLYFLFADRQSMLLAVVGLYGLFIIGATILVIRKVNKKYIWALVPLGIFSVVGFYFLLMTTAPSLIDNFLSTDLSFRFQFLKYFLNNSILQWYYKSTIIFWPVVIVLSILPIFKPFQSKTTILLFAGFGIYFILFSILLPEYSKPRYATSAQALYLPIYAIGIATFAHLFRSILHVKPLFICALLTILISTNFTAITTYLSKNLWSLSEKNIANGFMHPVTEEDLYGFKKIDEYFSKLETKPTILLSSLYGNYVNYAGKPQFASNMYIRYSDPGFKAKFIEIIENHQSGFYVVDDHRLVSPGFTIQQTDYCLEDGNLVMSFSGTSCHKQVHFEGKHGRFFVWKWNEEKLSSHH